MKSSFVVILFVMLMGFSGHLLGQDLTSVPNREINELITMKILSGNGKGNKHWLKSMTDDSLSVWSLVLTTPQGFKMYSDKQFAIAGLDRVRVYNKKRKLIYQLTAGTLLGIGGYLFGQDNLFEDRSNFVVASLDQKNNKTVPALAAGVLGFSVGFTIGTFIGDKTIKFSDDRERATKRLRAYAGF